MNPSNSPLILSQLGSAQLRSNRAKNFDRAFYFLLFCGAVGMMVAVGLLGIGIARSAHFKNFSDFFNFFTTADWDPVHQKFGPLSFLSATIVSSVGALMLAFPVSFGASLFLVEVAPRRLSDFLSFFVELLSTVPSVIVGLWGLSQVVPFLRLKVQPFLQSLFGDVGLFAGPPYGVGMMAAILILAIMLLPTLTALMREIFRSVPRESVEAALALGATRWESIYLGVVKASMKGLIVAAFLGLARAVGETMAVTLVIGNRNEFEPSLFSLSQTLSSLMASEIAEAVDTAHVEALGRISVTLFILSLFMREVSKRLVRKFAQTPRIATTKAKSSV